MDAWIYLSTIAAVGVAHAVVEVDIQKSHHAGIYAAIHDALTGWEASLTERTSLSSPLPWTRTAYELLLDYVTFTSSAASEADLKYSAGIWIWANFTKVASSKDIAAPRKLVFATGNAVCESFVRWWCTV